ncbi:hypothetical protein [Mycobacterium sp. ACS4331]|uniref:hypothetical protein n=1 Tax=Mycobacterium sp. ACS4331 TaxID=1834121 RepID=UPI001E593391|nr:hypothetical protein [Mycobacterium sp. ACS4331]
MRRGHRPLAAMIACGLGLTAAAPASAEPTVEPTPEPSVEPADPAPAPNATWHGPLAQSDAPMGPAGLPPGTSGTEMVLGQAQAPSAPGADPGVPPPLNAWNNAYLLPQHTEPAAPGEGTVVGVAPGAENANASQWDYLRRLYGMHRDGGLTGALLGQAPAEERPELAPGSEG